MFNIFLEHAKTNYFYVDEQFLRDKLQCFYSSSLNVRSDDLPWACTMLMVFVIGMQYALVRDPACQESTSETASDQLALVFYHQAMKLIPEIIDGGSIDSVQAFILLAIYTLPIDALGLSSFYLGIAIRIAKRNGLHRNLTLAMEPEKIEPLKRLWWTAYTLERYKS